MAEGNCKNGGSTISRITVGGMTCPHCVATVKRAIESVPGVEEALVDLQSGMVEIKHVCENGIVTRAKIAVTGAGYTVKD